MFEPTVVDDPSLSRPTYAEIDLGILTANYRAVEQAVGKARMLPVLKANAYGHGLVHVARHLETLGAAGLAVAFLEEGALLRRAGIRCPILVMGGIDGSQIPQFLRYDLTITASSVHKLREVNQAAEALGVVARVHLKVDTGMGRIGMRPETAPAMFEAGLQAKHVEVDGVYSHFATADRKDPEQTRLQLDVFRSCVSFYRSRGIPTPKLHIANSGAILQHSDSYLDLVRPGLLLFGLYPSEEVRRTIDVMPVLSWKSRVVFFKVQPAGYPVGYGAAWAPHEDTRIVTVPAGYGDGYFHSLSDRGAVLIGGRRRPIVGGVCMDQFMVDIGPGGEAYNGDEVVLIGSQGDASISAADVARWASTIPYEVLTNINTRVARRYVGPGTTS
ncbi:MAG: alanine racemase [bacterium]|nr:alanine racemase [bacterium]